MVPATGSSQLNAEAADAVKQPPMGGPSVLAKEHGLWATCRFLSAGTTSFDDSVRERETTLETADYYMVLYILT